MVYLNIFYCYFRSKIHQNKYQSQTKEKEKLSNQNLPQTEIIINFFGYFSEKKMINARQTDSQTNTIQISLLRQAQKDNMQNRKIDSRKSVATSNERNFQQKKISIFSKFLLFSKLFYFILINFRFSIIIIIISIIN